MSSLFSSAWFWVVLVVVIIILWVFSAYNKIMKKKMNAEQAFSDLDAYLTKRYDLIPNLVETTKGYAKHENETFTDVIKYRNMSKDASDINSKIDADNKLTSSISKLFAVAENYPDLKANDNFLKLQASLEKVENDLVGARRYYSALAQKYNYLLVKIPECIIAKIFNFKPLKLYTATDDQRENVQVKF